MMIKNSILRWRVSILFTLVLVCTIFTNCLFTPVTQASSISFVILSNYSKTIQITKTFYLIGITSSGKRPTWKSNNSKVASVNTYGLVTGKKAGTCKITGRIRGAEASCQVTVSKTVISLSAKTVSMENGAVYTLRGSSSTGTPIAWKSSKRSVATIDENGQLEAQKPGTTTITASADGTKVTCKVTVNKPKITLSETKCTVTVGQSKKLKAKVSSGKELTWRSKKCSVATVDEKGLVTARKVGTALITAKLDGITRICEIKVLKE